MTRLLGLYPRRWRARYGAELAHVVEQRPMTRRDRLDLIRGAIDAHRHPELVETSDHPRPVPSGSFESGMRSRSTGVALVAAVLFVAAAVAVQRGTYGQGLVDAALPARALFGLGSVPLALSIWRIAERGAAVRLGALLMAAGMLAVAPSPVAGLAIPLMVVGALVVAAASIARPAIPFAVAQLLGVTALLVIYAALDPLRVATFLVPMGFASVSLAVAAMQLRGATGPMGAVLGTALTALALLSVTCLALALAQLAVLLPDWLRFGVTPVSILWILKWGMPGMSLAVAARAAVSAPRAKPARSTEGIA